MQFQTENKDFRQIANFFKKLTKNHQNSFDSQAAFC
jgi:hypothetical protein